MIEIWTEELPPSFHWHPSKFCGGTIEFVVETAKVLSQFDDVLVYYDGSPCNDGRIYYLPREEFEGGDIVLSVNSHAPSKGRYSIYWNSWFKARQEESLDYDERIVLSPYHQKIFGYKSRIVPLSCHKEPLKGGTKIKGQCIYTSSPDRGLAHLKKIWPEVEAETGATLISTYSPSLSKDDLYKLYRESEFWLHPCQGIELFCIAAAQAQTAGCIPAVVPNMALETTVKYGVKCSLEEYEDKLIEAIKNPPEVKEVDFGSWESVTRDLFKNTGIFEEVGCGS